MNIIVHLLIAHSVRKAVNEQIGVRMNLFGFLYGNILPDLSAEYNEIPHFFKNSLGFVIDSAARLKKECCDRTAKSRRFYSFGYARESGVITHYLSDFFCYAHSEQCKYSICRHHLYELFMLLLFRKGLLFYQKQKVEPSVNYLDIENFVRENVQAYNNEAHLKMRDIYNAINVSVTVSICLLKEALCNTDDLNFAVSKIQSGDLYELGDELNESGIFL